MKRVLKLLGAGVLIGTFCAAFAACNEPKGQEQPEEIVVFPVSASDVPKEIFDFFDGHLMTSLSEFFVKNHPNESICLTINGEDELNEIVPSPMELPDIDFDDYTLVIGQYMIPSGGFSLKSQSIDTESGTMKLNLVLESSDRGLAAVFWPVYLNIFPKLPSKPIEFNCTYMPK